MKIQKLIVIGAIVCLLVGVSGAAMAADCPLGFIVNSTVDEITIGGGNCFISNVLVLGDVTIQNSAEVVIRRSRVFGTVRIVDSSDIGLFDNEVVNGDVLVIRPITAFIAGNTLLRSGPRRRMVIQGVGVNNEEEPGVGEAFIYDNKVEEGPIRCRNNNGQAFARSNIAASVQCPGQINDPS